MTVIIIALFLKNTYTPSCIDALLWAFGLNSLYFYIINLYGLANFFDGTGTCYLVDITKLTCSGCSNDVHYYILYSIVH
jgi:hypothetical protein